MLVVLLYYMLLILLCYMLLILLYYMLHVADTLILHVAGTFVLRVAASTINTGIYAQIGYNIISGDYGKFSIDFNGIISIVPNAVLLIADFGSKYTLQVSNVAIS